MNTSTPRSTGCSIVPFRSTAIQRGPRSPRRRTSPGPGSACRRGPACGSASESATASSITPYLAGRPRRSQRHLQATRGSTTSPARQYGLPFPGNDDLQGPARRRCRATGQDLILGQRTARPGGDRRTGHADGNSRATADDAAPRSWNAALVERRGRAVADTSRIRAAWNEDAARHLGGNLGLPMTNSRCSSRHISFSRARPSVPRRRAGDEFRLPSATASNVRARCRYPSRGRTPAISSTAQGQYPGYAERPVALAPAPAELLFSVVEPPVHVDRRLAEIEGHLARPHMDDLGAAARP